MNAKTARRVDAVPEVAMRFVVAAVCVALFLRGAHADPRFNVSFIDACDLLNVTVAAAGGGVRGLQLESP